MNVRRRVPELFDSYPDMPQFTDGDVFVIFAHADDELGSAGWLSAVARTQVRLHWILVSDSAAGFIPPFYRRGRSKASCRWAEAQACAAALGLPPPLALGLPDGRLHEVPNLGEQIWSAVEANRRGPLRAVVTHDVCGLYGHRDHLVVHDAVASHLQGTGVPLVAQALPRYFQRWLPLRAAARGRQRARITHKFDMDAETQRMKATATRAHKSQRHVFLAMMQGRSPEHFYRVFSREFYTIEG